MPAHPSDETDYGPIYGPSIAAIDAEIQELYKTRERLVRLAMAGGTVATPTPVPTRSSGDAMPREIRSDTFFGLRAPEAIKTFLAMSKRPKSAQAILDALTAGGYATRSQNPLNSLRTALGRLEEVDEVVRVGQDWGLAEWYPGRPKKKAKEPNGENGGATEPPPPDLPPLNQ